MGKITFEYVRLLFQQANIGDDMNVSFGLKLYEARVSQFSPPIYVLDDKGVVHSRTKQFAIKKIDASKMTQLFNTDEREYILSVVHDVRVESWSDLLSFSYETDYTLDIQSLPKYFDAKENKISGTWDNLVTNILSFMSTKDERLVKVFKSTMPRGFIMRFQPHTIMITPSNCGKSEFYDKVGKRVDKITKQTLLGSVRWVDEKSVGLFYDQYFPLIVEQVESQQVENLAGFLLSFLELGKAVVSGGGAEMEVRGACPFIITANPTSVLEKKETVLNNLVMMLSRNSLALGRRFGIIAYGNYAPVVAKEYNDVEHRNIIEFYRSMEERCAGTLEKIWNSQAVKEYCYTPIMYDTEIHSIVDKCESDVLSGFLSTFLKYSYPHTRGGSVNMAVVDLLPKVVAYEVTQFGDLDAIIDEIQERAKHYITEIKTINEESIRYALK